MLLLLPDSPALDDQCANKSGQWEAQRALPSSSHAEAAVSYYRAFFSGMQATHGPAALSGGVASSKSEMRF